MTAAIPVPRSAWSPRSLTTRRVGAADGVPHRRALQVALGLVWLLDAGLQYQPFMFGRSFVTTIIEPTTTGTPDVVARSVTWAAHVMVHHVATYNAIFATIQLLIAVGLLFRRTVRGALAASIVWALLVWWFGESFGGIFTDTSPLAGVPGGVVLYALIAVLLWPSARRPHQVEPSPATSGPLGRRLPQILWLVLWGSFSYFALVPANRGAGAMAGVFAGVTDGEPGWIQSTDSSIAGFVAHHGTAWSIAGAIACTLVAVAIFVPALVRPALAVAALLGLIIWVAEAFGGILTGQGTDPNTGLLLILLAACFWPVGRSLAERRSPVTAPVPRSGS